MLTVSHLSGRRAYRFDTPDGIVYRSRFDGGKTTVVLFDRAAPRVRLFPGSGPVKFGDAEKVTAAVSSTVPYCLV